MSLLNSKKALRQPEKPIDAVLFVLSLSGYRLAAQAVQYGWLT